MILLDRTKGDSDRQPDCRTMAEKEGDSTEILFRSNYPKRRVV
jgi:hypothetical protein